MTIVCAYLDRRAGAVWMGSDSRSADRGYIFPEKTRKIYRVGDWLIGTAGTNRTQDVVGGWIEEKRGFAKPAEIRDVLMSTLKALDFEREDNRKGDAPCYDVALLVARPGELTGISGDGCLWVPEWGFGAIGSGQDFAYGAAHALLHLEGGMPTRNMIWQAVAAACAFRGDCGGDIVIECIE